VKHDLPALRESRPVVGALAVLADREMSFEYPKQAAAGRPATRVKNSVPAARNRPFPMESTSEMTGTGAAVLLAEAPTSAAA
jgi:hypothetical protein